MADEFDARQLIINFSKDNDDVQALQFIRDDPNRIHFKLNEGNGLINYVYRVQSADNKSSVIIKYAEETASGLPDEKVSLERQELEYNCLKLMYSIQPGSVPEPYCLDKKHHVLAMADMSDWDLLANQLGRRHVDLEAAVDFGRITGKVHMETSRGNVTKERWEELEATFDKPEMKEYIRLFAVDRMYDETDTLTSIDEQNLEAYREYVKEIKSLKLLEMFNEMYSMNVCFIHGDCHSKSIFIKEGRAALFDFEFAFLGHPAFNLAPLLACYLLVYLCDDHQVTEGPSATGLSREGCRTACLNAIKNIVESYLSVERDISNTEDAKLEFLSALTLFTGSCVFMWGPFAQTDCILEGIDHVDRRKLMAAGFKMMKDYDKVKKIDEFYDLMSLNY